jgi:hypothetical protein
MTARACGVVEPDWKRTCALLAGHDGPRRECEISWPQTSPAVERPAAGVRSSEVSTTPRVPSEEHRLTQPDN